MTWRSVAGTAADLEARFPAPVLERHELDQAGAGDRRQRRHASGNGLVLVARRPRRQVQREDLRVRQAAGRGREPRRFAHDERRAGGEQERQRHLQRRRGRRAAGRSRGSWWPGRPLPPSRCASRPAPPPRPAPARRAPPPTRTHPAGTGTRASRARPRGRAGSCAAPSVSRRLVVQRATTAPSGAAGQTEQQALGQELPHQPQPPGAERGAGHDLAGAHGHAGEQEVGDVGAGRQQDERHRRHEHPQRSTDRPDDDVGERSEADADPGLAGLRAAPGAAPR